MHWHSSYLSWSYFYCPCHTKLNALYKAFIPTQSDCGTCMFDKMECTPSLSTSKGFSLLPHTRSKSAVFVPSWRGGGPHPATCYLQVDWFKAICFLLTQGHSNWIVPLYLWVSLNPATHKEASWSACDSCFPEKNEKKKNFLKSYNNNKPKLNVTEYSSFLCRSWDLLTHSNLFFFITTGLLTRVKCPKPFPTEPKHFSPLRRLTVSTFASLACTCRSMAPSAHSPTLGLYI